jgi:glycine cleavage system regulatory protein
MLANEPTIVSDNDSFCTQFAFFGIPALFRALPILAQHSDTRNRAVDHLVVTVFAADRPGLVERIAQCIGDHQGNWLESRMARMAGQFTGIVRIGIAIEQQAELKKALRDLAVHGIQVLFAENDIQPTAVWKHINMELVGNDRPGIVREITRLLAEQGVNVERLVTDVRPAPMSSEMLFHAEAILGMPLSLPLETLQKHLETLADDLMVELVLKED